MTTYRRPNPTGNRCSQSTSGFQTPLRRGNFGLAGTRVLLPATLSKSLLSAEYPGNRGVQEGISLGFAVSCALWLRVDFLPERACSLMYSALPAHSALPTDGTDPEGSQLAAADFFDPAVQCPTSVGRCTPQTPEDRFGTAPVTVGYDVGALIEHPLEPWKVSMLAGWSRAVVARLAGGFNARSRRTCYRVGCAVRLTRPVALSRPPRF